MRATTIEDQDALLQCCALRKVHVIDGPNMCDQGPNARDQMYIPFILSPNECWLHTCDACVRATWRLGLRSLLVARNDDI